MQAQPFKIYNVDTSFENRLEVIAKRMNRKCHTAVFTYDDVVLIVMPKHSIVAQVFKDSIGIWVVVEYC